MNFVPLYIKTHNSLLSSLINENDLIEYANKFNLTSLTITDNNMYGVLDFYHLCKKNDIKPIIGLEIEIDSKKGYVIIFKCKKCNAIRKNKAAKDDNMELIIKLSAKHD